MKIPSIQSSTSKKVVSVVLTVAILGVLLLAGPANAFDLSLSGFSVVDAPQGTTTSTTATITVNANDVVNVDTVVLSLTGPENRSCVFDSSGLSVSGCDGVSVELIDATATYKSGYGYDQGNGYGYGYHSGISGGVLKFLITLDASNFSLGTYNVQLSTTLSAEQSEQNPPSFELSAKDVKVSRSSSQTYSSSVQTLNIVAPTPETHANGRGTSGGSSSSTSTNRTISIGGGTHPHNGNGNSTGSDSGTDSTSSTSGTSGSSGGFSRITGAVIGALGTPQWYIPLLAALTIALASFGVRLKRRSSE